MNHFQTSVKFEHTIHCNYIKLNIQLQDFSVLMLNDCPTHIPRRTTRAFPIRENFSEKMHPFQIRLVWQLYNTKNKCFVATNDRMYVHFEHEMPISFHYIRPCEVRYDNEYSSLNTRALLWWSFIDLWFAIFANNTLSSISANWTVQILSLWLRLILLLNDHLNDSMSITKSFFFINDFVISYFYNFGIIIYKYVNIFIIYLHIKDFLLLYNFHVIGEKNRSQRAHTSDYFRERWDLIFILSFVKWFLLLCLLTSQKYQDSSW